MTARIEWWSINDIMRTASKSGGRIDTEYIDIDQHNKVMIFPHIIIDVKIVQAFVLGVH